MKKLFVGNLPYSANETDVQGFFESAGIAIDIVTVMRDRFTGQARGFGFVEINDDGSATRAVDACNGKELMGRALDEGRILQIAHAYEQSTEWHKEKPPL